MLLSHDTKCHKINVIKFIEIYLTRSVFWPSNSAENHFRPALPEPHDYAFPDSLVSRSGEGTPFPIPIFTRTDDFGVLARPAAHDYWLEITVLL